MRKIKRKRKIYKIRCYSSSLSNRICLTYSFIPIITRVLTIFRLLQQHHCQWNALPIGLSLFLLWLWDAFIVILCGKQKTEKKLNKIKHRKKSYICVSVYIYVQCAYMYVCISIYTNDKLNRLQCADYYRTTLF